MRRNLLLSLGIVVGLFQPVAIAAESSSGSSEVVQAQEEGRLDKSSRLISQAFFNIDDDVKGIAMYPFEHPKETLLFLGGIGVLVAVDKPVTTFYQDKVEPIFDGYSLQAPKLAEDMGFSGADGYLVLGVAGSYLLGAAFNDEKSQKAALLAVKASAYSVVLSHLILKPLLGRNRPVPNLSTATGDDPPYTTNPYDFGNHQRPQLGANQSGTAMPSFHFTEYFAVARVYSKVYDNYLIPYSVTALLLTSNIKGHKHWVADMVAGALLGTMIGTVVADNVEEDESSSTMVIPSYTHDRVSLTLYHQF